MAFTFTDAHVNDYYQLGFTVFRDLLPTPLLRDLRREADKGRAIARQRHGQQAQRIQPVAKVPEMDMRVFDDFHELPALRDALNQLLAEALGTPVNTQGTRETFGVLYEPGDLPSCTIWHRDWRDNIRGLKVAEWEKLLLDLRYFNQVNCALYEDCCTWVVPGSHLRRDTAAEVRRFPDRPIPGPRVPDGASPEEIERACLDYARSMPGAVQTHLNAGDYLLYRNSLWHLGNYVPYKKRSTIHDGLFTPEFEAFFKKPPYNAPGPNGEPPGWENPNLGRPEYAAAQAAAAT